MKRSILVVTCCLAAPTIALAHDEHAAQGVAPLHVDAAYSVCFFDLHPELTQHEFDHLGVWGTLNPQANYGLVGVDGTISVLEQGTTMPVSLAIRPHATALLGPEELWVGNVGADASVGMTFSGVTPYVAVGGRYTLAVETSKDVDLRPGMALRPVGVAGVAIHLGWLNLGAEAAIGELVSYGFLLGASI